MGPYTLFSERGWCEMGRLKSLKVLSIKKTVLDFILVTLWHREPRWSCNNTKSDKVNDVRVIMRGICVIVKEQLHVSACEGWVCMWICVCDCMHAYVRVLCVCVCVRVLKVWEERNRSRERQRNRERAKERERGRESRLKRALDQPTSKWLYKRFSPRTPSLYNPLTPPQPFPNPLLRPCWCWLPFCGQGNVAVATMGFKRVHKACSYTSITVIFSTVFANLISLVCLVGTSLYSSARPFLLIISVHLLYYILNKQLQYHVTVLTFNLESFYMR